MDGWIKLSRKLKDWEWYHDSATFHLFIHILLNANHKDKNHRGVLVRKGQFKTGRKKLSEATGLTERTIRTILNRLKSTNELTIKTTKQYSIITVVNWELYQGADCEATNETTNRTPTSDQRPTTTKNEKNEKKEKNNIYTEDFESFWEVYGSIGNKKKAFDKYKTLRKEMTHEEVIKHHDRYSAYCGANRDWYHKQHAATWLHSGWSSEWGIDSKPKQQPTTSARQQWLESRGLAQ